MLFVLLVTFTAIAAGLAWFLVAHDRGEREPIAALWMAAGFGIGGALLASWLESRFVTAHQLLPGTAEKPLLITTLTIGVIEEACKFVPLAIVLWRQRYFNEHTDGMIYFALAGLGFGLPENILYTLQYGAKTGLVRVFLTPVFHAATTGIVGYFLARRKLARRAPWGVIGPLAVMMVLHALYDFGLASGVELYAVMALFITLGLSSGLFLLFVRATERDQDRGLSAVGNNSFCRSCGKPNPQHHLYCVQCGQYA